MLCKLKSATRRLTDYVYVLLEKKKGKQYFYISHKSTVRFNNKSDGGSVTHYLEPLFHL